ncbi:phage major capsid protein [Actinoplanes sp. NPDC051861]|uniref:phage major capsid protein n=1 Tax=Actinoplanes sp. NPDC051861 TaxID=3155170 RepID=UPI0034230C2A
MSTCPIPTSDELRTKAAKLADNLTKVAANEDLPAEIRSNALNELSGDVVQAAEEIRKTEEAETRALNEHFGGLTAARPGTGRGKSDDGPEWRHLVPTFDEYRALMAEGTPAQGGYSVPQKIASQWIEKLRNRSVFMSAPGLNMVPFDSASFRIPAQLTSSTPSVVAEGATIPKGDITFGALDFNAIKYGSIYQGTSEILEDSSLPLEKLIAETMIDDMAVKVDFDAFQGTGGTAGLFGISSTAASNTTTTLSAGKTLVTWDDVLDAYIAVLTTGRTPTVVWCSMDQYKGLIKSRENGTTGAYLAGSVTADPMSQAWGLPILPSANLPVRTVIVADASRIYVGVRRDIRLNRSDEYGYGEDVVSWKGTARYAGIRVAEATSVQKIVAAAS